jgi:hypothetical protein
MGALVDSPANGLLGGLPGGDGELGDLHVTYPSELEIVQDESHLGHSLIAAVPAGTVLSPGVDHGHDVVEAGSGGSGHFVFAHETKILQIAGHRGQRWTVRPLAHKRHKWPEAALPMNI